MPFDTELELTKVTCYRSDLPRIRELGEKLEILERAGFSSQHSLSYAVNVALLDVDAKLQAVRGISIAPAMNASGPEVHQ